MKKKQIVIFIVLSGIFSLVYSQDIKKERYITEDQKQHESAENKIKINSIKKPAVFVPSEKITADSSVSFPVDI